MSPPPTASIRKVAVCVYFAMFPVVANGQSPTADSSELVAQEWGTMTGRFVYPKKPLRPKRVAFRKKFERDNAGRGLVPDDPYYYDKDIYDESMVVGKEGGLANVVIFVRDKHVPIYPVHSEPDTNGMVLKVEHGRFEPHVSIVRTGEPLAVVNLDPVVLNVRFVSVKNSDRNFLLMANAKYGLKLERDESLPIRVSSSINPWMAGYVLPRNNPYAVVTDKTGRFTFESLPVGEWEFQVWHERTGWLETANWPKGRFRFAIRPGSNDLGKIVTLLDKN